ncbi:hypothetical protein CBOM_00097 [Ceraceosorus bombacis]|uniref:DUF7923 domain-containing protein n=1 Tax=Ceraceosorus bombacis TaxID=401625 RepID=A0A0P1B974_9BASI|nr:hypothetical protein CBOM_00097 [Ceraceosorus bombacis]
MRLLSQRCPHSLHFAQHEHKQSTLQPAVQRLFSSRAGPRVARKPKSAKQVTKDVNPKFTSSKALESGSPARTGPTPLIKGSRTAAVAGPSKRSKAAATEQQASQPIVASKEHRSSTEENGVALAVSRKEFAKWFGTTVSEIEAVLERDPAAKLGDVRRILPSRLQRVHKRIEDHIRAEKQRLDSFGSAPGGHLRDKVGARAAAILNLVDDDEEIFNLAQMYLASQAEEAKATADLMGVHTVATRIATRMARTAGRAFQPVQIGKPENDDVAPSPPVEVSTLKDEALRRSDVLNGVKQIQDLHAESAPRSIDIVGAHQRMRGAESGISVPAPQIAKQEEERQRAALTHSLEVQKSLEREAERVSAAEEKMAQEAQLLVRARSEEMQLALQRPKINIPNPAAQQDQPHPSLRHKAPISSSFLPDIFGTPASAQPALRKIDSYLKGHLTPLQKDLQRGRHYAAILLDGDNCRFLPKYVVRGKQGARDVINELKARVPQLGQDCHLRIMVFIALYNSLASHKHFGYEIRDVLDFYSEISQNGPLNIVAEVGREPQAADLKVKTHLADLMLDSDCKHIYLGGIDDSGYHEELRAAQSMGYLRRVSLIHTGSLRSTAIKYAEFKDRFVTWGSQIFQSGLEIPADVAAERSKKTGV